MIHFKIYTYICAVMAILSSAYAQNSCVDYDHADQITSCLNRYAKEALKSPEVTDVFTKKIDQFTHSYNIRQSDMEVIPLEEYFRIILSSAHHH